MIKLTNAEIFAIHSFGINNLFADSNRQFPAEVAFRLSEIVQATVPKVQLFQQEVQRITKENGGYDEEGKAKRFPTEEQEKNAAEQIAILAALEIEILGEQVQLAPDWPKLTVQEMSALKPLIKV